MIVSYDEHDVNNTFKFGVIYQKARQVSIMNPYPSSLCFLPGDACFPIPHTQELLDYVLKHCEYNHPIHIRIRLEVAESSR